VNNNVQALCQVPNECGTDDNTYSSYTHEEDVAAAVEDAEDDEDDEEAAEVEEAEVDAVASSSASSTSSSSFCFFATSSAVKIYA
jgi:hypothetical protein